MYRNPRPRQFFNPRAMHMMNRPSGPRFEPGSAGYYPSAPPSQFRYKSSNARGRGYPRSSFPANRGRQREQNYDFKPKLYFRESMLANPWEKLEHVIKQPENTEKPQQTKEDVKEEIEDKPIEQTPQT